MPPHPSTTAGSPRTFSTPPPRPPPASQYLSPARHSASRKVRVSPSVSSRSSSKRSERRGARPTITQPTSNANLALLDKLNASIHDSMGIMQASLQNSPASVRLASSKRHLPASLPPRQMWIPSFLTLITKPWTWLASLRQEEVEHESPVRASAQMRTLSSTPSRLPKHEPMSPASSRNVSNRGSPSSVSTQRMAGEWPAEGEDDAIIASKTRLMVDQTSPILPRTSGSWNGSPSVSTHASQEKKPRLPVPGSSPFALDVYTPDSQKRSGAASRYRPNPPHRLPAATLVVTSHPHRGLFSPHAPKQDWPHRATHFHKTKSLVQRFKCLATLRNALLCVGAIYLFSPFAMRFFYASSSTPATIHHERFLATVGQAIRTGEVHNATLPKQAMVCNVDLYLCNDVLIDPAEQHLWFEGHQARQESGLCPRFECSGRDKKVVIPQYDMTVRGVVAIANISAEIFTQHDSLRRLESAFHSPETVALQITFYHLASTKSSLTAAHLYESGDASRMILWVTRPAWVFWREARSGFARYGFPDFHFVRYRRAHGEYFGRIRELEMRTENAVRELRVLENSCRKLLTDLEDVALPWWMENVQDICQSTGELDVGGKMKRSFSALGKEVAGAVGLVSTTYL